MWFSKSIEQVLEELDVNPVNGLSEREAETRNGQFGSNQLRVKKRKSILLLFLGQLNDALIYVLFG
ncbi:MAG TPA: cation-transporting P-type ATPase, partial [Flavitalea sp.]|nr:cation-transporting P-type ATPase [Flavitalea sp.]